MSKIPGMPGRSGFFVPEEIIYSLNFLFDILWKNIYFTYVPKFG